MRSKALTFLLSVATFHLWSISAAADEVKTPAQQASVIPAILLAPKVQLIVRAAKTEFRPGEPVSLEVVLSNQSRESLRVVQGWGDRVGFQFEAKNARGLKIPMTQYGKKQSGAESEVVTSVGPPTIISLAAGQEMRDTFVLNRLIDMSEEGSYTVTARRLILPSGQEKAVEVVSQLLPIEIVEPAPFTTLPVAGVEQEVQEPIDPNFQWKKSPTATWELGDTWTLSVQVLLNNPPNGLAPLLEGLPQETRRQFEDAAQQAPQGPALLARYHMMVQVNGEEKVAGKDCWQLVFLPDTKSPSSVQYSRPLLVVDKETGQTVRMENVDQKFLSRVEKLGELTFPVETQFGYPLPLLPVVGDQPLDAKSPDGSYHMTTTFQTNATGRITEIRLSAGVQERFRVKQRWLPGAKWWNEYELSDTVRNIVVRATRVKLKP